MNTSLHLETVERLTRLSETDLQRRIIEPLLRLEGYTSVRETSGPNDKGKDLIAFKDDFGRQKVYALQIKKFKFSGKHNSPAGLPNVITQLKQAFAEPIKDPQTKTLRFPDRCIFITPFPINREALESAFHAMADLERKEITIIDGPILVDMITKHNPSTFAVFDVDWHYRCRLAAAANVIHESPAFGLPKELELSTLYVDVSLTDRAHGIMDVANLDTDPRPQIVTATWADFRELKRQCALWKCEPSVFPKVSQNSAFYKSMQQSEARIKEKLEEIRSQINYCKAQLDSIPEEAKRHPQAEKLAALEIGLKHLSTMEVRYVNIRAVATEIMRKALSMQPLFSELNTSTQSPAVCTAALRELTAVATRISDFANLAIIKKSWPALWTKKAENRLCCPEITSSALLKSSMPVFIRGGAGAGKTTLLRHLCQKNEWSAIKSEAPLPILIQLIKATIASQSDIIGHCIRQLRELGRAISKAEFRSGLARGRFRILFDGLDETGAESEAVFLQIKKFSKQFPLVPIIVTGRDTYPYSKWSAAAHLRINSFSNERLTAFVNNWFTSEPSKVSSLMQWLSANQRIREAACTPLIAALLCSLVGADAELPSTEMELYEQRFELLLGRWEKAKGGSPMSASLRRRYWHFMRVVAFSMHMEANRSLSYAKLLITAEAFYDKNYHLTAENFIMDCLHRGVLFREPDNAISFGHLTYQEFLAAKHLVHDNPIQIILRRIGEPWWSKVLDFYAALRGDVKSVIIEAMDQPKSDKYLEKLLEMCNQATLTPKQIRERLKSYVRGGPSGEIATE